MSATRTRRPWQVRGVARCGQAAASVLKNRLQALPGRAEALRLHSKRGDDLVVARELVLLIGHERIGDPAIRLDDE